MIRKLLLTFSQAPRLVQLRHYARRRQPENLGIHRRLSLLEEDKNLKLDPNEDPEDILDPESDFMDLHNAHKEFEQEMRQYREKLPLWIVRDKYFKRKGWSFLTWGEKEQIRHLHNEDPVEWSVKQLAHSFPADTWVIKKVLKSKWYPDSDERIVKHDQKVKETWDLFKKGQIPGLNKEYEEHLKKFADRDFDPNDTPKLGKRKRLYELNPPRSTEFVSIITSSKKYQEEHTEDENKPMIEAAKNVEVRPEMDLLMSAKVDTRKPMTLRELKRYLGEDEENEKEEEAKAIDEPSTNSAAVEEFIELEKAVEDSKNKNVEIQIRPEVDRIREFVKIPRHLYKPGATYKLKDCFYDSDGEFLYRVPGFTK